VSLIRANAAASVLLPRRIVRLPPNRTEWALSRRASVKSQVLHTKLLRFSEWTLHYR
jgi:hypothetical protein